ncbi:MAG: tripartite tricarboxylate transporter substrate binding protein [Candidimonas sp.]|jgi:tripartite-type tricarboxylate transporter receptor subunit TctC
MKARHPAKHGLIGLIMLCFASIPMAAGAQSAQSWPSKPIHVITPFPTGGINDIVIRAVSEKMADYLGQPIVIEQKTGAGGNIGTSFVAASKPDGYTWLASSFPVLSVAPVLYKDPPFDPVKDFRGAAKIAAVPNVLVAYPGLGINSVDELVEYGKKNPKALFYGSPARGSSANIATEELKRAAGFDASQVIYKGAAPAITDLISGQIQFTQAAIPLAAPQIQAGKLKALAVMSLEPSSLLPDVPTMKDSKYRDAIVEPWYGIHVPAGTPDEIVDRINQAAIKALASPEVRGKLESVGGTVAPPTSARDVDKETLAEVQRWQALAKEVNLSGE